MQFCTSATDFDIAAAESCPTGHRSADPPKLPALFPKCMHYRLNWPEKGVYACAFDLGQTLIRPVEWLTQKRKWNWRCQVEDEADTDRLILDMAPPPPILSANRETPSIEDTLYEDYLYEDSKVYFIDSRLVVYEDY